MGPYRCLLAILAGLAGCIIVALTVLIGINVAMRNTGFGNLSWLHEIGEYALYAVGFLATPWVLHHGGHVAVDIVVSSLPARAQRWTQAVAHLAGASLSLLLVVYGAIAVRDAHASGSYRLQELAVAEWWLLALMPVSAALMLVEFLIRLRQGPPVDVPPAGIGVAAGTDRHPPQRSAGL